MPPICRAADESAFAHALGIALLRQAAFTILHVTPNASADWSGFPAVRRTLERWNLLDPGSAQEDVFEKLGMKVRKLAIESRFAALAVARHLDSQPADLLVVATEGREGVARWLRGSVAEAMARWSQTMTLFVPADAERNIVSPADGNLTLKNVLIPVDHSPDAGEAIKFARRAAEVMSDEKVTITLLHIGDETAMPIVYEHDGPQWTFARMHRDGDVVDEIVGGGRARPSGARRDADGRSKRCVRRVARQHDGARAASLTLPPARGAGASPLSKLHAPPHCRWLGNDKGGRTGARSTANSPPAREVAQLAFLPIHAARRAGSKSLMARIQVRAHWLKPRRAWLLGLFLAGAAAGDEVVKTYEDPNFDATLSKILVVGVHADRSVRGQFENTVARTLRSVGASSEASLYSVGNTGELSAETLIAAARTVRADAVMVTRVVDVQTQNPDVTASLQDYFRKYSAYEDPLPGTAKHTVRVRTDLYLVDSQAQLWGVESTAFEKQDLFAVIDGIAKAVTAQLRSDGIIR